MHFADGFPLLLIGQASLDDLSQRVGRPLEMLRFRPNLVGGRQCRVRRGRLETHPHRLGRVRRGQALFPLHPHHPGPGDRRAQRGPRAADDLKTYREKDGAVLFRAEPDCAGTGQPGGGDAGGNPRLRNGRPPLRRAAIAGDQSLASTQPVLRHSRSRSRRKSRRWRVFSVAQSRLTEITVVLAFAAGRVALLDPGDLALLQQGFLAVVQVLAQGAELLVQLAVGLGKLAAAAIHAVEGVARRTAGVGGQGAVGEQQAGGGEQGGGEGLFILRSFQGTGRARASGPGWGVRNRRSSVRASRRWAAAHWSFCP